MRLEWVQLQNFRCYADQRVTLGARPVQLFLGENGRGKSALIDGTAAFLGMVPWATNPALRPHSAPLQHDDVRLAWATEGDRQVPQRLYPTAVRGEVQLGETTRLWSRALNTAASRYNEKQGLSEGLTALLAEQQSSGALPLVARYSVRRFPRRAVDLPGLDRFESPPRSLEAARKAITEQAMTRDKALERWRGYEGALDGGLPWADLRIWWGVETVAASLQRQADTRALRACTAAVRALLDLPSEPRYELDLLDVVIQRHRDGPWEPVGQLSDGYRTSLALAVDLARRAHHLNPGLGEHAAAEVQGVVLLDEVDLHLHPGWQRTILRRLHTAFPRLQFLATTHAPAVLIGAGEGLVDCFVLEEDKHGAITPRSVPYQPGASQDDVLTGPWFQQDSAVDPDTEALLSQHARLYRLARQDPEQARAYAEATAALQRRLNQTFSSSVEDLVMDVVTMLLQREGRSLQDLSWAELQALRERALAALQGAR